MPLIGGGRVLTTEGVVEAGWVEVEAGRIGGVEAGHPHPASVDVDLAGRTLVPGFVDQHCHGGGGHSFVTTDPAEAAAAAAVHRTHGTTTILASLVSGTFEVLAAQIRALSPLVDTGVLAGIHLEGPWISRLHCGAHDVNTLRAPDADEVHQLLALGGGRIKMVTIAPELPGALDAIRQIVRSGAVAAVGHTDADYDTTRDAIAAGATVATHLFNAMRPLHHREPNAVGALLEDPRVTIELISDGTHVHPAVLELVGRTAGQTRVAFITDAMAAAAAADGRYRLGELDVDVMDGIARLVEGGAIAGSTLTLDKALRLSVLGRGMPLATAVAGLCEVPARTLGLTDRGRIAPGCRADLLILNERLEVEAVMVGGHWMSGPMASAGT